MPAGAPVMAPHALLPRAMPRVPLQDMAARGCERNVITYSSLISACERAGRCDIALRVRCAGGAAAS
jgi:hypothetical protein